jgi:phage repressor protein C with HTH and peptisase S24 domain
VQTREGETVIKRVIPDHDRKLYTLRSDNKRKYKSYTLGEEDIFAVFRVLGKLRMLEEGE